MSKPPPPAPTASAIGPCPTIIQISRTPRHWKFTQHHRTIRPPPFLGMGCWNTPFEKFIQSAYKCFRFHFLASTVLCKKFVYEWMVIRGSNIVIVIFVFFLQQMLKGLFFSDWTPFWKDFSVQSTHEVTIFYAAEGTSGDIWKSHRPSVSPSVR